MILTIIIWGLKSKNGDSTIKLCLEAANYGAFMVLKPGKTRMTWRISWEYHGHNQCKQGIEKRLLGDPPRNAKKTLGPIMLTHGGLTVQPMIIVPFSLGQT